MQQKLQSNDFCRRESKLCLPLKKHEKAKKNILRVSFSVISLMKNIILKLSGLYVVRKFGDIGFRDIQVTRVCGNPIWYLRM